MNRIFALLASLALLAACTETRIDEAPEDLGDFKLRVAYVFADNAVQGPVSRDAVPQEWVSAIEKTVDARLGRYSGSREIDIGISLEGYMLAPPGVPVLYSPKSTAIALVHVYDVAAGEYLARRHQIQVFENTSSESLVVGSGHSRTREQQLAGLALNLTDRIEEWLARQHKENGWFDPVADTDQDAAAPAG